MIPNRVFTIKDIYDLLVNEGIIDKKEIKIQEFKKVVKEFHQLISHEIVFKAYKYKFGEIGEFSIVRDKRRGKSINWGASNKRKQEIIDSGQIPFNKETAPDGIKWFIYHEGDYFKWHWYKSNTFVKNINVTSFRSTRTNRVAVGTAVKNDPFAETTYGIR